jgi:hypothetical protein
MYKENTEEKKEINIRGTQNRYLINKLKKEPPPPFLKKRKDLVLPDEYFTPEKQGLILSLLYNKKEDFDHYKTVRSQIDAKISGYRAQDSIRKRLDTSKFIDFPFIVEKLYDCQMRCFFCQGIMFLLYDLVREMKQWTVDRINNDEGHNRDNVLISCLDCNLKRRRTNKEAFLFTKQLTIVKEE